MKWKLIFKALISTIHTQGFTVEDSKQANCRKMDNITKETKLEANKLQIMGKKCVLR